ncbi:hypothetical protein ACH50O_18250 [Methylomonas sp. 2BW1-5-20]
MNEKLWKLHFPAFIGSALIAHANKHMDEMLQEIGRMEIASQ